MENEPNSNNTQTPKVTAPAQQAVIVDGTTVAAPIPPVMTLTPLPSSASAPKKQFTAYLGGAIILCIILAVILPASAIAQFLAIPIFILGTVTASKFMYDTFNLSKGRNALIRLLSFMVGLGVGWFIFCAFAFIAVMVGFSKDPQPQHTG